MPSQSVENMDHMEMLRQKESESVTRLFQKNMTEYEKLEREAS